MRILCELLGGSYLFLDCSEEGSFDFHGEVSSTKLVDTRTYCLDLLSGLRPKGMVGWLEVDDFCSLALSFFHGHEAVTWSFGLFQGKTQIRLELRGRLRVSLLAM